MPVPTIRGPRQPRGAALVIQAYCHGDLERLLERVAARQTKRPSTETLSGAVHLDPPTALPPARAEDRLPFARIDPAQREPARHRDTIRLFEQRLEGVDRRGETEVGRQQRFHVEDAMHAPALIQQRPAAVAGFDRHRQLDHREAVEIAPCGNQASDKAEVQAERIAHRHNTRALLEIIRIAKRQRG